jgi:hypothetical protein
MFWRKAVIEWQQKQPNQWSCFVTAFAMACRTPVEKIIKEIGHDGSAIIFPENPEPYCRRGFYPDEIIVALLNLGFVAAEINPETELISKGKGVSHRIDVVPLMLRYSCVVGGEINGNRHAAFWDHKSQHYLDPNGTVHRGPFYIESLWVVSQLRRIN